MCQIFFYEISLYAPEICIVMRKKNYVTTAVQQEIISRINTFVNTFNRSLNNYVLNIALYLSIATIIWFPISY